MAERHLRVVRLALALVAVTILGLGILKGQDLWLLVTTRRVYHEGDSKNRSIRGWVHVRCRSAPDVRHGPVVGWYVDTGFKAGEGLYRDGQEVRMTEWHPDGTVDDQSTRRQRLHAPPWLWGVTDQVVSSAPAWILDNAEWAAVMERAP